MNRAACLAYRLPCVSWHPCRMRVGTSSVACRKFAAAVEAEAAAQGDTVDLGSVRFREARAADRQHLPKLYEALQRCGSGPSAVSYHPVDELAERVDVSVILSGTCWKLEVLADQSKPDSKRANETWPEAVLRHAKHVAAQRFMQDPCFSTALETAAAARRASKEAAAEARRVEELALPTMTDLVANHYIDSGAFKVRSGNVSTEVLSKIARPTNIGIDAEGFDTSRHDWRRAWLVQLAWCGTSELSGQVAVLLVRTDQDMQLLAEWMNEAAQHGCNFFWFDKTGDIPSIFRGGSEPEALKGRSFDLSSFGSSLHALAGEHLLGRRVRKHERMSESFAYLPETQGVTDLQVRYAAADAVATLLLGRKMLRAEMVLKTVGKCI